MWLEPPERQCWASSPGAVSIRMHAAGVCGSSDRTKRHTAL
jgi:hypothetical protein